MNLKLIWCQDQNCGIGLKNQLPWKIDAEMKHFKQTTQTCIVVMGRKTFVSIGKPLPNRTNWILSHNKDFCPSGVEVFNTIEPIIAAAKKKDVYVIGGKQIYELFWNYADDLIVSTLFKTYACDLFFQPDFSNFNLIETKVQPEFTINYYQRKLVTNSSNFSFKTKRLPLQLDLKNFEGSLALLWTLIKERKYDLWDLDVAILTEQYLIYIHNQLDSLDLDLAADYLLTASQLINLKAKFVFAISPEATEEAMNKFLYERELLVQRLLEYKKIRKGINWLRKKQQQRMLKFTKKVAPFPNVSNEKENLYLPHQVSVHKLKEAFELAIAKMQVRHFKHQELFVSELSIEDVEVHFKVWFDLQTQPTSSFFTYFQTLPHKWQTLKYFVVVFLVILTLVRSGQISIYKIENFADIHFEKTQEWTGNHE